MKKGVRAFIVCEMLFRLNEGKGFTEAEIMEKFSISRSSFYRSLSEIRCYLAEHRPWNELVVKKTTGRYQLTQTAV